MGYFKDVIDIVALKDETYKRLGNDPNAFQRYSIAYMLSQYILTILLYGGIAAFFAIVIPESRAAIVKYWYIGVAFFLIAPLLGYILNLFLLGIKYGIGLCLGGKPKSFKDFAVVADYITPIVMPFLIIPLFSSILIILYTVWKYVILYKTYRIIHKLEPNKAGWAVGINVGILAVVMVSLMVLYLGFIFSMIAMAEAEPESISDTLNPGYGTYYEFEEQMLEREVVIETESTNNIDVYIVKDQEDFNHFMDDEDFSMYYDCYFEEVSESYITCTVTTGGVIVYNPGEYAAEYTITMR